MAQIGASGTQVTLGEMAAAQEPSAPDPSTHDELIEAAKEHAGEVAAEHFPEIDVDAIEWWVSTKATRSAGSCKKTRTGDIEIRLTWGAYQKFGWEEFTETIRHELIHAYEYRTRGKSGHGTSFKMLAEKVDAPVHCRRFTEPKYIVYCTNDDCDTEMGRQKRSKVVKQPGEYPCKHCGSPFDSKKNPDHPDH